MVTISPDHMNIPKAMAKRFVERYGLLREHDFDDLVAEASLAVVRMMRWANGNAIQRPGPLLIRAAWHSLLALMRKRRWAKRRGVVVGLDESEEMPASAPGPVDMAETREQELRLKLRLRVAMGALPERHRDLIRKHYWGGVTLRDMTRDWGSRTEAGPKEAHRRALRWLRRELEASDDSA